MPTLAFPFARWSLKTRCEVIIYFSLVVSLSVFDSCITPLDAFASNWFFVSLLIKSHPVISYAVLRPELNQELICPALYDSIPKPCHHSNFLLSPSQQHSPVCRQANVPVLIMWRYCVPGWPWHFSSCHGLCALRSWLLIRRHCCPANYNSTTVISVNMLSAQICQTLIDQPGQKQQAFFHLIDPSSKACKGKLTCTGVTSGELWN